MECCECVSFPGYVEGLTETWGSGETYHKTALASIYLQHALALITRQDRLDGIPLPAIDPIRLRKRLLPHDISALEKVPITILGESPCLHLRHAFHIFRHLDIDVRHLQVLQVEQGRVEVNYLRTGLEIRRRRARQRHKELDGL
jgi:hypothetical protein